QAQRNFGRAIVENSGFVEVDRVEDLLGARIHRTSGRGGIRGLGVDVVGLHDRRMREQIVREVVLLAEQALLLAGKQADAVVGRNAHAVSDEQDDVLGGVGVGLGGD